MTAILLTTLLVVGLLVLTLLFEILFYVEEQHS